VIADQRTWPVSSRPRRRWPGCPALKEATDPGGRTAGSVIPAPWRVVVDHLPGENLDDLIDLTRKRCWPTRRDRPGVVARRWW